MNSRTTKDTMHENTRHVRVRMPGAIYRALRHRLVDATDERSMSEMIVCLLHERLVLEGDLTEHGASVEANEQGKRGPHAHG